MSWKFWKKAPDPDAPFHQLPREIRETLKPLPTEHHEPSMEQVLAGDNPTSGGGSSGGYGSFQPFMDDDKEDTSLGTRPPHLEREEESQKRHEQKKKAA